MSRKRVMLAAAFAAVVIAVVVLGGRLAAMLEHWLLALHGRH